MKENGFHEILSSDCSSSQSPCTWAAETRWPGDQADAFSSHCSWAQLQFMMGEWAWNQRYSRNQWRHLACTGQLSCLIRDLIAQRSSMDCSRQVFLSTIMLETELIAIFFSTEPSIRFNSAFYISHSSRFYLLLTQSFYHLSAGFLHYCKSLMR